MTPTPLVLEARETQPTDLAFSPDKTGYAGFGNSCYINYQNEWMNQETMFRMMMNHPSGIFSTVIMAPFMENES